MTKHPFDIAEHLAPVPDQGATADDWTRHYAALALAAWAAFHAAMGTDEARDLGYLSLIGTSATAAAIALTSPHDTAPDFLWDHTPEAGALNGEWEQWIVQKLDALGVNPADIHPSYVAGDFRSPSQRGAVA